MIPKLTSTGVGDMATMVPGLETVPSINNSEKRTFEALRVGLPDDWIVLHALNLSPSETRVLGDINIILAGKNAIHGISTDRPGASWLEWHSKRWHEENQDPFSLGSPNRALKHSFLNLLRSNAPGLFENFDPVVGIGFSLSSQHTDGREAPGNLVLNLDPGSKNLAQEVDRLTKFWAKSPTTIREIDKNSRIEVIRGLRPTLDRRMSLTEQASRIGEARIQLTNLQYELFNAFDIDQNPRFLVNGRAGTGKTLCAIELAKMEANNGKRVLFTCYNRKLEEYLQQATDPGLDITITRLHNLCRELVDKAGMSSIFTDIPGTTLSGTNNLYTTKYPKVARDALKLLGTGGTYDVIIIDEGQDIITANYLELYNDLLRNGIEKGNWAIFYDTAQSIYHEIEDQSLQRLKNTGPVALDLNINCRNTLGISRVAGAVSGIEPVTNKAIPGMLPDLKWYKNSAEQRDQVSEAIRYWIDNGINLDQIIVLSRYQLENSGLCNGLNPDIIEHPLVYWDSDTQKRPTGGVVFSTIHAFKGLESDYVVMTDIDDVEEENSDRRKRLERLYYVGSTRATIGLTLSASTSVRSPIIDNIMLEQAKDIPVEIKSTINQSPILNRRDSTSRMAKSVSPKPEVIPSIPTKMLPQETWYGTWGSKTYEIIFKSSQEPGDKFKASGEITGYHGAPTQLQLGIDSDTTSHYIFVDEFGKSEESPSLLLDSQLVTNAERLFLINETGEHVTLKNSNLT